jgi:drug/metabolite transporter (DMT)-like permease
MADIVTIDGKPYKRRNPWGVLGLAVITLGIYFFVWYYKINKELREYGITNDPGVAVLAVTLGSLIIVPPLVSLYKTADRILQAQKKAPSEERIIPVLALLLVVVVGGFAMPYYQTQLNKVYDEGAKRASGQPAAV